METTYEKAEKSSQPQAVKRLTSAMLSGIFQTLKISPNVWEAEHLTKPETTTRLGPIHSSSWIWMQFFKPKIFKGTLVAD